MHLHLRAAFCQNSPSPELAEDHAYLTSAAAAEEIDLDLLLTRAQGI